jgi:ABC-type amino acid transport system permease subunit
LTAANQLTAAKFQYTEPLLAALVYYLVIVSILMIVQARLERKFTWKSRGRKGGVAAPGVPVMSSDAR